MSIFTCSVCGKDYNEINKRPLILPCGHVYCEECINQMKVTDSSKGVKCPSDSIIHKIELQKIPICAQILCNLPKQSPSTDFIHCARHPSKRIKFYCQTHNIFPCSICITEHTDHNIVCFEPNKTDFIAEVKALNKQLNAERALLNQIKLKREQYEKTLNYHQETQMRLMNNHFNHLLTLLKERKKQLMGELSQFIVEKKKQIEMINQKYSKSNDLFMDMGNKLKYIEELYKKGEYELFIHFKQKTLNEIKVLTVNEPMNSYNIDALQEFCLGPTFKLNEIVGEFKLKSNLIRTASSNSNVHITNSNSVRNIESKAVEDTRSIDSISTFMLHNNDTNNIFKQNLLTVNDGDDHPTLEVHNKHLNKNDSKTEYQHFVALSKQEGPVALPVSVINQNKSQSNRENKKNNNQIYIQKPFQHQNSEKKTPNAHFNANALVNKHNQNQVIPQQIYQAKNSNPISINSYLQNDTNSKMKKPQAKEKGSEGRVLYTEASYDKSRKKSNDYMEYKYSPLFSSPNENKALLDRENKLELEKKRYVNSITSNTNSNNSNSNSSHKNIAAQRKKTNRSCNKPEKKKKNKISDP